MKLPIIPIVVALVAGIGGGTGYAFMSSAPPAAVAAHADSTGADSTHGGSTHGGSTHGDSAHATAGAAGESPEAHDAGASGAVSDSIHHLLHPADLPAGATSHESALPLTPADSIRDEQNARAAMKAESKGGRNAAAGTGANASATAGAKSHVPAPAAAPHGAPAAGAPVIAVKASATTALAATTALPEQRLAKIFGAMQAKDAGKVLEQMTDSDIRTVLGMMSDRQAAAILSTLTPQRAAAITKGIVRGGTP